MEQEGIHKFILCVSARLFFDFDAFASLENWIEPDTARLREVVR